jgi:LAO/AO transport system kinase
MLKSTAELAQRVVGRDRQALAKAITLVESTNVDHRRQAELLLDYVVALQRPLINPSGSSINSISSTVVTSSGIGSDTGVALPVRLGIAGPPGAGKSTLIETLGCQLTQAIGHACLFFPHGASAHPLELTTLTYLTSSRALQAGLRVAVLTIDPSSHVTGGSILGDKSRMTFLSRDPRAFVRASPSRGVLGGLSRYTADVVGAWGWGGVEG